MKLHLEISGVLLIGLALSHVVFPHYFQWRKELQGVSLITRQILYVHTFFIAFTVLLMGLLCVSAPEELASTALGRRISLGLFAFWFARLIIQFFGYSSSLWKGKVFETSAHVAFTLVWTYLSAVFFLTFLG